MTHDGDGFWIEKIKDDQKAVNFYTGFYSLELLMVCFTFLGNAVSDLSYQDHHKETKGKSHKLSPLNEFFLMLYRLCLGLYEQDLAHRFGVSQTTVSHICSTWINFVIANSKKFLFGPVDQL